VTRARRNRHIQETAGEVSLGSEALVAHRARWWLRSALALGLLLGGPAHAVQLTFGLLPESAIVPQAGDPQPLVGSITIDVDGAPLPTTLLRLTDVSVTSGALSIALDPTLASPGLGVLRDDGSFLVPTLFLRIDDGVAPFDLAVPNVTGMLGEAGVLESLFEIDSGGPAGILTVRVFAAVPEPGTLLLVGFGIAALLGGRQREIAR
jgi:hypothetical protein